MAAIAEFREGTLLESISSMNDRAEKFAAEGEWDAVSDLLVRRNAMLREIGNDQLEVVLRAAIRSTARIRAMVEHAKANIGKDLEVLHRGQEAAQIYNSNT